MKKSYLLLHTAVFLAGFTGVFGKLITLNEGLLTWYRVLFSAIFLFLILQFVRVKESIETRDKLNIGSVGLLIMVHWVFFYASIKYSNISIGVVCYSLTSFFTALLKPLIRRSSFVLSELFLSGLTLLGISCMFHLDASYQIGIVLGVISSIFAALYTIFNEQLANRFNTIAINFYQMLAGVLGLGIVLPVYLEYFPSPSLVPQSSDLLYLILLSVFCTVGLYVLVTESLKKLSAFTVNLSFNLEPIYAIVIAFLFFNEGEQVSSSFYIGLFFVLLSVVLQSASIYKWKARK